MKYKINTKIVPIIVTCIIALVIVIYVVDRDNDYEENEELFSEISYEVLPEFELDDEYYGSKYYRFESDDVYCSFDVNVDEKDDSGDLKKWFSSHIYSNLSDKVGELKELTINDNKVYHIYKKSNYDIEYYYGISSSNYYYLITYRITDYEKGDREDIDSNLCYNAKDKIISTIKVK